MFDYAENYTNVISLRIFNLFGFEQPKEFLIPSILEQIEDSDKIYVNDIRLKRDYLYIKDLVRLIAIIVNDSSLNKSEIFNVGSGKSYGVLDIIAILSDYHKKNIKVINKNVSGPKDILDCYADISKIKNYFNWNCKFSFESGLIDYVKMLEK